MKFESHSKNLYLLNLRENLQEFNPEEQKDPQKPAPSFIKNLHPFAYVALVLFIIFFLYQFIGAALVLTAGGGGDLENFDVEISRIVLAFGQYMFILAPVIFFARFQTADLKGMFRIKIPKASLMLLAIFGIVLIQPFLQGYIYFQEQAINSVPFIRDFLNPIKEVWDRLESSVMKIVAAHSSVEFAVIVFVICITPAICEEFLFRGFVLTNLAKTSKATAAIFLSGFLFAIYHFQPFSLLPLVILGWYLGFVVYYSNSIFTGIVCHFINNFLASYYLYVYGKENFDNPQLTGSETMNALLAGIFSLVSFVIIIMIYYRLREKESIPA
jgi:membrane protease YdiL (CAAX protease family)